MSTHVRAERMELRLEGGVAEEEQRRIDAHVASCDPCRGMLGALALAAMPGSEEEEAFIARLAKEVPSSLVAGRVLGRGRLEVLPGGLAEERAPSRERRRGTRRALAATAAVLCLLAAGWLALPRGGGGELGFSSRAIEGRPASAFLAYAPHVAQRGGEEKRKSEVDEAIGRLLGEDGSEARALLVALYLWRGEKGDLQQAAWAIESLPPGPQKDNDAAIVLMASGRSREAVELLRRAVALEPGRPEFRFNLALALGAAGNQREAAGAWQAYLRLAEGREDAAWIAEAREHLKRLEGG